MTITAQQLEQYLADLEYDNLRSEGYRSVVQKSFEEYFERKERELIYREDERIAG